MHDHTLQRRWDLDEWCDRFESEWKSNSEPSLSQYLSAWAGPDKEKLFRHLLELELDYRARRGEKISYERYQREFPEFASALNEVIRSFQGDDTDHTQTFGTNPKTPKKSEPSAPTKLGNYEILAPLGKGGMGVVYKARQSGLNRTVALKTIRSGEFASPEELARFRAEAEAAAALSHPAIVPVYEVGEDQGRVYFSMELVEGESLAAASAERVFTPAEAARVVEASARAIAYAHEKGIVHRDLKPGNILLDLAGNPRIMDFGLAKSLHVDRELTATGQVIGTPNYMPPEQARGDVSAISATSDVYSLGAVLYRLITGRPPFQAATLIDTLRDVLETEALPPSKLARGIPRDLDTICLKCLEKSPSARYASAAELADELARFQRHEPIKARPISRVERAIRWCRRNRLTAGLSAGTIASVLIGTIVAAVLYRDAAQKEIARVKAESLAESRKQEVALKEQEAAFAEQSAETSRTISEHGAYALGIGNTYREWGEEANSETYTGLLRTRPDLRGWEFGFLSTLCTARDQRSFAPPGIGDLSFLANNRRILMAFGDRLVLFDFDSRTGAPITAENEIRIDAPVVAVREHAAGENFNIVLKNGHMLSHLSKSKLTAYLDLELAEVTAVKFSGEGKRMIAVGTQDKPTIRLWDWERLSAIEPPEGMLAQAVAIAISADGSHFAGASEAGMIGVGKIAESEGKLKGQWVWQSQSPVMAQVRDMAFCDQGETLAVGGSEAIEINRHGSRKVLHPIRQDTFVPRVACSRSGHYLAVGINTDRRVSQVIGEFVLLIDRLGGNPVEELLGPNGIAQIEFSDDESKLLCRGIESNGAQELRLWQLDRKNHRRSRIDTREFPATAFALNRDQTRAVAAEPQSGGRTLRLIDTSTGIVVRRFEHEQKARFSAFSDDGNTLLIGRFSEGGGRTDWFDLGSDATGQFPETTVHETAMFPRASRGGRFLSATLHDHQAGTQRIRVWKRDEGKLVFESTPVPLNAPAIPYVFSNAGDSLAYAAGDRIVHVSLSDGRELLNRTKPVPQVSCLRFSPNDNRLAIGATVSEYVMPSGSNKAISSSLRIVAWDLAGERPAVNFYGGTGNVRFLDFSADGTRLLSGDALYPYNQSSAICLWDAHFGFELLRLPLRDENRALVLADLGFSSDGTRIAAMTADRIEATFHEWHSSRDVKPLIFPD